MWSQACGCIVQASETFNFKHAKLPPNTLNNSKVDIELVINVITSVMCVQFLMFPALLNLFWSYIFCLIAFVEEVYAFLGDICLVCLPSLPSFRELGCGFYREAQGGCWRKEKRHRYDRYFCSKSSPLWFPLFILIWLYNSSA